VIEPTKIHSEQTKVQPLPPSSQQQPGGAAVQQIRLKFSLHMVVQAAARSSAVSFANHQDHAGGPPTGSLGALREV
jgi:hypothetical protein